MTPASGRLSGRAVLSILGDEARPFLQGLVTQDVLHVQPGAAVFAALLTPQGKIIVDFFLAPVEGGFLLDVDAGAADALLKRLKIYRLRAKIDIAARADLMVRAGWGSPLPAPPEGGAAFDDPRLSALGWRSVGPADGAHDAVPVDEAYDVHRLALGVPAFGRDFGPEEVFLLDVNYDALHAVNYKKGCFVGQEVTSRMKRKGEVRKRTLRLAFEGPPLATGESVVAGGATLGEVLSSRAGDALALIRVDRLAAAEAAPQVGERPVRIVAPDYLDLTPGAARPDAGRELT